MSTFLEFAILSLGAGGVYAWVALGTVVIHRGSGILNFAQGALLMFSAYVFNDTRDELGVWLAGVLSTSLVAALSAGTYVVVMRPLRRAAPLTRTVATLGLLIILQSLAVLLYGTASSPTLPVLPDRTVGVLGTDIGVDRLVIVVLAGALAALLWAFFTYTTTGLATTASAENPRAVSTLGWSPDAIGTASWFVGGAIAGVAGVLIAPTQGPLSSTNLSLLIVPGLAAAVLGSFHSFPIVFAGALGLAFLELETNVHLASEYSWLQGLDKAVPLAVVVAFLAVRGRSIPERGHQSDDRPELGTGHINVTGLVILLGLTGAGLLTFFSVGWVNALTANLGWGIIMLSVVVLVGYTGQLSLGQLAFSGISALIAGRLVATTGTPFWLAVVLGVLGAVPVGVLFALPALRTRGLNLAVVTLSLAVAVEQIAFKRSYLSPASGPQRDAGILAGLTDRVEGTEVAGQVTLFGASLDRVDHPVSYALFALGCATVTALAVANLRRSRAGRRLVAVRTNERAAASLGVSIVGAKIYAFALSAAIAGLGGIVLAFQNRNLGFGSGEFDPFKSVIVVAFAVVGGVGYVTGAFAGALLMPATLGAAAGRALSDWFATLGSALRAVATALAAAVGFGLGRVASRERSGKGAAMAPWLGLAAFAALGIVFSSDIEKWLEDLDRYLPLVGGVVLILLLVQNAGGIASENSRRLTYAGKVLKRWTRRPDRSRSLTTTKLLSGVTELDRVRPAELVVQGLTVTFGAVHAVRDVSFRAAPGEVVGLIGPNGAGKTTLIDAITGYTSVTGGTVALGGQPLDGMPAHRRARAGVSRSFQNLELFEDLTVLENIRAASDSRDLAAYVTNLFRPGDGPLSAPAAAAIREFALEGDLETQVSKLPYGRRRLVAIARAAAASPSVLLLDEPAAGLDEGESRELAALVRRLCDDWGLAVVLIEHDMAFVMSVCDRVVVLDFGSKIAEGSPADIQADSRVITAYLGDPDDDQPASHPHLDDRACATKTDQ